MEKLRVAIVGCGGIANQKHMPSLKANADKAEMVAFCDIIPERAEKAAKEYGAEARKFIQITKRCLQTRALTSTLYMYVHRTLLTARSQ